MIAKSFLLFIDLAHACPGCAGSMDNPKDMYLVYILMGFVLLTSIPFAIMYRMIIKNRRVNEQLQQR